MPNYRSVLDSLTDFCTGKKGFYLAKRMTRLSLPRTMKTIILSMTPPKPCSPWTVTIPSVMLPKPCSRMTIYLISQTPICLLLATLPRCKRLMKNRVTIVHSILTNLSSRWTAIYPVPVTLRHCKRLRSSSGSGERSGCLKKCGMRHTMKHFVAL